MLRVLWSLQRCPSSTRAPRWVCSSINQQLLDSLDVQHENAHLSSAALSLEVLMNATVLCFSRSLKPLQCDAGDYKLGNENGTRRMNTSFYRFVAPVQTLAGCPVGFPQVSHIFRTATAINPSSIEHADS